MDLSIGEIFQYHVLSAIITVLSYSVTDPHVAVQFQSIEIVCTSCKSC